MRLPGSLRRCEDQPITDLHDLFKRLAKLQKLGQEVSIYPDAEELIQQRLLQDRLRGKTEEIHARIRRAHPLREGAAQDQVAPLPARRDRAFAAGAGRAILADDMGLGKTIQGIGTAELLANEAEIKKVLIVCPASLKSQWRTEIQRCCDRDVQLVEAEPRPGASSIRMMLSSRSATMSRCSATSFRSSG